MPMLFQLNWVCCRYTGVRGNMKCIVKDLLKQREDLQPWERVKHLQAKPLQTTNDRRP